METGSVLKKGNDSIATMLQELIDDEIEIKGKNAMAEVPNMVESVVEQFFRATTFSAQRESVPWYSLPWSLRFLMRG